MIRKTSSRRACSPTSSSRRAIFFGPLLLLVSIGLVTLIVLLAMDLRMGVAIPPAFVDDFTDTVNKRQFKEAFDMARTTSRSSAAC